MEEGFTTWTSSTGSSYTCNHCGPLLMQEKQKKRHLRSAAHKRRLREQTNNENAPFPRGHNTSRSDANELQDQPPSPNEREIHCPDFDPDSASPTDSGCRRSSNDIALAIDGMIGNTYFEEESREEDNALPRQIDRTDWMEYEMERIRGELSLDEDDLVGSLLVGYTRNLVSRTLYDQIRSILNSLCHLKIPAWATVRRSQQRIRDHLNMEIKMKPSVWGMPCAALSSRVALQKELANPHVAPFIDFYPEDPQGRDQFKLSQSQKWLDLPSTIQPQMCINNTKHFYVFEPVQTSSNLIVVPLFFYTLNSELCAKCIIPTIQNPFQLVIPGSIHFGDPQLVVIKVKDFSEEYTSIKMNHQLLSTLCKDELFEHDEDNNQLHQIQLPNPWRTRAGGKIIRNMPITLYSNDTSGNVLKRWNKHVSFYFTLSGLPPRLSNQEFNCHFLTTSNRAGVLELSEMIIDELNSITTGGCEGYDVLISQPVLFTTSVLFFLGDSPMHAEITNTPLPNTSLNPCRMCSLSVTCQKQKHSKKYLREFLQLDQDGNPKSNPVRVWKKVIEASYDLFDIGFYSTLQEYERMAKFYGIKDHINEKMVAIV
ncbi:hypothetical protein PCASD_01396 [Puccinia coronata f. sp. avenae]|uniref:C2H2-type domain-containing protein n=1 Tax=Puccinia coronata f. sp. avenae TaxID=200324 RepID=A0A2N5VKN3_9BASI|nr:hypothetical protein PCASD_01396 [Puccinia coronata f. sp. avenae]